MRGKGKGKNGVARKARAGANKTTEPEVRKSLEQPEEGCWDDRGVWQEGGAPGSPTGEEGVDEPSSSELHAALNS